MANFRTPDRVHDEEGNVIFEYILPVIRKDPSNIKWYVHYSIKYPDKDKKFVRYRHYGRDLNREPDLKKRQRNAKEMAEKVARMLKRGIDPKNKNSLLEAKQRTVNATKRYSFELLYEYFLNIKGYKNPKPKQIRSAMNMKRFFTNQFLPHLKKHGIDHDMTLVDKAIILDLLNDRYLGLSGIKWNSTTYNNARAWIGTLFNTLIYEERLPIVNPCDKIKRKPKNPVDRYEVYTPLEIKIIFNYLKKVDFNYLVACQMIYYAYIRSSEISRLKVSSIDLTKRVIRIRAEDAKGSVDGLEKDVLISKDLHASLMEYFKQNSHKPTDYLFGKKVKPCEYVLSLSWHEKFKDHLDYLKDKYNKLSGGKHKTLFNRNGLTMYSLKHSGVTHFVHNNMKERGTLRVLQFIQHQCRHSKFEITQLYLKKLPVSIEEHDEFKYIGF